MFGLVGHAYVYFIYGMYNCFNVVAYNPETQKAGAVLIRALKPVYNIEGMIFRRKKQKLEELTSGSGKLCRALDISRNENSLPLWKGNLLIADDNNFGGFEIVSGSRIGIKSGAEFDYRYYVKDCEFVSRIK